MVREVPIAAEQTVEWQEVGIVEILLDRVYPIDPLHTGLGPSTEVIVPPGVYPVYRKGGSYSWVMRGRINGRCENLGGGLMVVGGDDEPTGLEVQFPHRTLSSSEFDELLASPECQPGARHRYIFRLSGDKAQSR
ncbi:Uncharacterised protein [Mycobacteroides abscessus subsp. abscessus]|uniref:hypothetical protein n=1 Tax=Mycobacteroides abscessus TaxID=36809 RepID=UPI00092C0BC8|nr:hypothetical protein [Mycobacteroides abscessus]SIJ02095.1 Uncharacterised protein [Mycobacteroides abscessus subsp. abscessus]SIN14725.1 Uncharacterised protein [Mycobacteroides abscessus subsp. abscessus]